MIIICGRTIEECEKDLAMAKKAIETGMPMGCGGATVEDAEMALTALKRTVGGYTAVPAVEEEETVDIVEEMLDCLKRNYEPNEILDILTYMLNECE